MKNEEFQHFRLFGAAVAMIVGLNTSSNLLASEALAGDAGLNIARFCHDQWPNDYSMEEYCQKTQRVDLESLRRLVSQYQLSSAFIDPILRRCTADWTNGSGLVDYTMVEYCIREQVEAAERLGKAPSPGTGAGDTDATAIGGNQVVVDGNTADTSVPGSGYVPDEGSVESATKTSELPTVLKGTAPRLTFGALVRTWKRYIGKRVVVVSAEVSRASKERMLIAGEGGEFWARGPRNREEVAYLLRNCSGRSPSEQCVMPVSGVVRQFGSEFGMVFPEFQTPD